MDDPGDDVIASPRAAMPPLGRASVIARRG
jgi:hypothetical protein